MITAWCIGPVNGLLTFGKQYEIIKTLKNAYLVKRDDDSIDRMDKSRFTLDEAEFESLQSKINEILKVMKAFRVIKKTIIGNKN